MTASLYGKRSAHTVASSCGDSGAYPELCENKISVGLGVRIRANQPMSQRVEGDTVNPGTKSLERNKVLDADAKERQSKRTREAIESRIKGFGDSTLSSSASATNKAKFVKYAAAGMNNQRVVKVQSIQEDPMNPSTLKLKKIPMDKKGEMAAVTQSPPRHLSDEEKAAWIIPASVSNWKNPKGYTIPLDKRLAADGRGLVDVKINDNFAKFSEVIASDSISRRSANA